jgi:transketolase
MRKTACELWSSFVADPKFVFLTGDVGYNALEQLRDTMGSRFVNAGLAEQNMMSVAAGLTIEGMNVWVYSIAPFCYARPFEQIRNDICQHGLPVKIVGNGGGYGYGAMGASHHALEDYGTLLTLDGLRAFIPAFAVDLKSLIPKLQTIDHPAYLRLGRCNKPTTEDPPAYEQWRKLLSGGGLPIVLVGPIAGEYWSACIELKKSIRPSLWVLGELPLDRFADIPTELAAQATERGLCVVEEHVVQGSVGQQLAQTMQVGGCPPKRLWHFYARGYPSKRYGSQSFHQWESGITAQQVLKELECLL